MEIKVGEIYRKGIHSYQVLDVKDMILVISTKNDCMYFIPAVTFENEYVRVER